MAAVPPLLQLTAEPHRKQRQHRGGGPGARLKQFNGIGGATPRRQVGNKATSHPTPAGLLAALGQPTTGPWQLLTIEEATAGADHAEAVLPPGAGVNAAGVQQFLDIGTAHGDSGMVRVMQGC